MGALEADLPAGTVTFLRSDVEGSMELIAALGVDYDELNAAHLALVRAAVREHGGHMVRTEGDACFAVFTEAGAAASAAIDIQRAMADQAWPVGHELRLRIGLHSGAAARVGDDYGGFEVSRAARIASTGWGGQIVISDTTRALLGGALREEMTIRDLGRHRLKGVPEPERLFQLDTPGRANAFPPLRGRQAAAEHLPDPQGLLIGRASDLEQLERHLETTRLLTLTGPGGSGKTTLALELGRRLADRYADGARLVDLQAVRDAGLVRGEIARGVGLLDGSTGRAEDRLAAYLGDRELLLIIDNFEQVISAAGVLVDILAASPASRVIVTSRLALRLRAEQEFPVRPLQTGGDAGNEPDAVALFLDRARRVRPHAGLAEAELDTVRDICRRVDGLPLAIELCAAQAATLPVATILDRLQRHQPLPGTGPRDLPDRQRTIDQTVEWSVSLLAPSLQRLFARLAVFEESFDLDQAEQVVGAVGDDRIDALEGVVALGESSLIQRVDGPAGGVRFGWLQTVRDHALARLAASGEADEMRARHARAYARLVTDDAPRLPSAAQRHWLLERLPADDANLRAATLAAVELGDVESGLRLAAGLWQYWLQNGRLAEGRDVTNLVLAMPGADAPTSLRVRALDAAGSIAYWIGEMDRAALIYEEELALARAVGDRPGEALALLDVFFVSAVDDPGKAVAAREAAAEILAELDDDFGLARLEQAAILLGLGGRFGGGFDPSGLELVAARAEGYEDTWLTRLAPAMRGYACLVRGEYEPAIRWLTQALRANLAVAERTDTALAIQFGVVGALLLGRPDLAAVIHGAARAAFDQLGVQPVATYEVLTGSDPIPAIEAALGPDAFAAAVDEGRRLSLEEAIDRLEAFLEPAGGG